MIKELNSWIKRKGFLFAGLIFLFILSSSAAMAQSQVLISPNRYVVLDDPNTGTKAPGFFNPADVRGGNWGSNYWYGESTTIRAVAMVINDSGTPLSGITITFRLKNPAGTLINTTTSATDNKGLAYYLFDLNNRNYWGYWTIEADATVNTGNINNITSFALNWWGCAQCHNNKVGSSGMTGTFGSYASKSYYTIGADFHRNPKVSEHRNAMAAGACTVCHQSYNGTATNWRFSSDSPNIASHSEYSPDWHKNKVACQGCHQGSNVTNTRAEVTGCYDTAGCHPKKNNNLTGINSTTGYAVGGNYRTIYSFIPANTAKAHNGSASIPCIVCHDAGHNISKPFNTSSTSNTFTEYQQCTVCHSGLQQHNNNLSCTVCHSQDAHSIKIFAQDATYVTGKTNPDRGNCTNCHQDATFLNLLISEPKAGNYGKPVPQIPKPFNHSTDQYSGSLWNGTQTAFWDNMSQISACNYCHGAYTLHNSSALGNIGIVKGSNSLNQSLTGGSWCQNCHYKNAPNYTGDHLSPQPPEVLNLNGLVPATSRGGTTFYNHSGALSSSFDDATCKACHNNNLATGATSLNLSHNVATGSAGGRDCVSCHDKGKSVEKVDVSKMNQSDSIHNFLNSNSVIVTPGLNPDNKRCWACHTGNSLGTDNVVNEAELPASGHPNDYNVPKKCTQCHIQGNFSAFVVSEHFSGSTEISTKFYTNTNDSCVNCHNKSEMLLPNSDPNGPKSIYAGVSHYGSNKTNAAPYVSGGSANCTYCHQDPANSFTTEMIDAAGNSSISNHTELGTNPACINCHNSGRIHFATLTKPAVSSTLCANCHTNKDKHNGSLECIQCHMQSNRSIHPIQYLQPDTTFKTNSPANKSSAVNCTNCHQGAGVSGFNAPVVPEPLNHSIAPSTGQKWGNYWDNNSAITACYYCHQNEIHQASADLLGNVSTVQGSNTFNNPDLANSTWCANCHYGGASEYKGNLLAIPPPEITDSSLVASDGTIFFNHNGLSNFNDSDCKNCHGSALSGYAETSLNLSHSVSAGGGDNCILCHGTNYIGASPSVTRTFVNISAFNESIHQNINSTPIGALTNDDCWMCHNKEMNRQNVKKCDQCHMKPRQWHGNAEITTNLSELW